MPLALSVGSTGFLLVEVERAGERGRLVLPALLAGAAMLLENDALLIGAAAPPWKGFVREPAQTPDTGGSAARDDALHSKTSIAAFELAKLG